MKRMDDTTKLEIKNILKSKNYKINKIMKETQNNMVIVVNNNYVVKVLNLQKTIDKYEILNMETEVDALKYFTFKLSVSLFFPTYIENFIYKQNSFVVMSYIKGKTLIEYRDKNMPIIWWKSLIYQLILVVYILEDNKILHNDFWDANIILEPLKDKFTIEYKNKKYKIPECGFIVKIIDFQYTNQYKKLSKIRSPFVLTTSKEHQNEKKRLGWSNKFHVGGDLHQILGILSEYKYIPKILKKNIEMIVSKNEGTDFPYTIQTTNKKTAGEYLLQNFNNMFSEF